LGGGSITSVSHVITLQRQDGDANLEIWRTTTPLRAYSSSPAAGTVDIGLFFRSTYMANVPVDISCAISGYMVGQ
jgi:hypothetical protein